MYYILLAAWARVHVGGGEKYVLDIFSHISACSSKIVKDTPSPTIELRTGLRGKVYLKIK
jgi:hypothetical protein